MHSLVDFHTLYGQTFGPSARRVFIAAAVVIPITFRHTLCTVLLSISTVSWTCTHVRSARGHVLNLVRMYGLRVAMYLYACTVCAWPCTCTRAPCSSSCLTACNGASQGSSCSSLVTLELLVALSCVTLSHNTTLCTSVSFTCTCLVDLRKGVSKFSHSHTLAILKLWK